MKFYIALVLYLLSLSIHASPNPTNIKIGMVYFYPPFVMSDGTGFDAEIVQLICHGLKVPCKINSMSFKDLFNALDNNEIDIAVGGITIGASNPEKYMFSLPYLLSRGAFLVNKTSAIQSIAELKNKKIGIIRGSRDGDVFYQYLRIYYANEFQIQEYGNTENLVAALQQGDISAAFTHESTVHYWELNGGNRFKTLGRSMIVGDGIGIMALANHGELISKINQQILQLEQTSTYLTIYRSYFHSE